MSIPRRAYQSRGGSFHHAADISIPRQAYPFRGRCIHSKAGLSISRRAYPSRGGAYRSTSLRRNCPPPRTTEGPEAQAFCRVLGGGSSLRVRYPCIQLCSRDGPPLEGLEREKVSHFLSVTRTRKRTHTHTYTHIHAHTHTNTHTHTLREIGILLPNNQRQHRTLHIQKDVLPDVRGTPVCASYCAQYQPPLRAFSRMDSISTSYTSGEQSGIQRYLARRKQRPPGTLQYPYA